MHEDPQIPNFGKPGTGPELEEGMVFAVEPMVNAGTHPIRMASDNWSVYSQDGSLAAHFEHTVAITADGPRILTPWHLGGGPAGRLRACYLFLFARGAVSWALRCNLVVSPIPRSDEGPSLSQADVREVQDHPPPRRGPRDLPEPAAQAEAGLRWHELQA